MTRLLLSLFTMLTVVQASLALPNMKFQRLDTRDGLSSSQVNCVYRDSRGFVWIGTAYGLNRYDGYRIKTFYSNRLDSTSMRDNYTDCIMEDNEGRLWLKQGMNYCVYTPTDEHFERNVTRILEQYGISGGVEHLYIDSKKNFWVKLYEAGFCYYNVHTKKLTSIPIGYEQGRFKPTYGVSSVADYNGKALVATYTGELVCIDGEKGKVVWEDNWMRQNGGKENQSYKITIDAYGNYWIVSQDYTFIYIRARKSWYRQVTDYLTDMGIDGVPEHLDVWDARIDGRGWLWVATDHKGLFVVDLKNKQMRQFLNNKFDETTISDNTLRHIDIDSKGNVWIGTYKNGVNQYREGIDGMRTLELGDINTVTTDQWGNYWLGSNNNGIIVYDPKTDQQLANYTTANSPMVGNIMVGSFTASDGSIWFGGYNSGLTHCLPTGSDGQAVIRNYHASDAPGGLATNNVWSVTEDKWHRIWIATLGGGLQLLTPANGTFRTWSTANTNIPGNYLTSLCWIKKGWLMVGTNWYYSFVNPVTGKIANRVIPESPTVTVNTGSTICAIEDSRGLIWQGSSSGVCVYDQQSGFVTLLDMTSGLLGSSICSVTEDNNHMMWVVTEHGISKIVPERQHDGTWQFVISSYSSRDGLQKGTYNQRSAFITRDGMLLVGGQGGLDIINTNALSEAKSTEHPVFSGLQIFDVDVPVGRKFGGKTILPQALDILRKITLNYNDQFTIQLASDAGNIKSSKRFVYQLEGFNENWVKTSELNPNITYNSLRAGHYTLRVRMLNDDGTIGHEESTLDITIQPPLWRTRWAMLLYVLLVLAAALLWRRWFLKRQRKQLEVEELRRELDKKVWMSEMLAKMKADVPASEADSSVDDSLELGERLTITPCHLELVAFLRRLCSDFRYKDAGKSYKLNFITTADEIAVSADPARLREAFTILFRNSVQFSVHECLISVGVALTASGRAQIQVADNGIGINEEIKPHVFEHVVGGGIGLETVHDIIVAHDGDISIKDNPGGGTIFVISLPVVSDDVEEAILMDDE